MNPQPESNQSPTSPQEPDAPTVLSPDKNSAIGPATEKLLEEEEKLKNEKAQAVFRMKLSGASTCLFILAIVVAIVSLALGVKHGYVEWSVWRTIFSIFVGFFVIIVISLLVDRFFANLNARDARQTALGLAQVRLRIAQRLPATDAAGKPPEYFDSLVRINVENLERYYILVKAHTNKSFIVSIAAGAVGFFVLIAGLIAGFFTPENKQMTAYLTAGAGLATEFIASVFFYLYSRTVRQLKEYHDSLLDVQNILLSFKIVGDQEKGDAKLQMMMQMLSYLISQRHAEAAEKSDEAHPHRGKLRTPVMLDPQTLAAKSKTPPEKKIARIKV